ncbi:MAG: primosomal protein N' [Elusimicrobia bacterium]|nr:primosomal protein N' [Elusimicrobiota bacterium]
MIADIAFPVPLRKTFCYRLNDSLLERARPGLRVLAPFGPRTAAGLIIRLREDSEVDLSGFKTIKTVDTLLDGFPVFKDDVPALALWMQARWNAPVGLAVESFFPRALPSSLSSPPSTLYPLPSTLPSAPALTGELAGLAAGLSAFIYNTERGKPAAHVLFGPPQHGRYEVYLELIKKAVSGGGQVLCLVPDLNLIPHFMERLGSTFKPEALAVWHSRITVKQKRAVWTGVLNGSVKIVLGARSAAFLPFRDLALAIIDEEQDDIYKQEEQEPNFHARTLLLKRAQYHNTCLVLASACPSMEAYAGVEAGRFTWNELPRPDRGRPKVAVIDMEQYPWDIISPPLAENIKKAVGEKKQVLVIAGRKGYASLFMCANCGWMKRCGRCRVPMGVKKDGETGGFVCWRCGRKEPIPETCPKCSGKVFREKGTGTQKVEGYLKKLLPGARVARFDGDLLKSSVKGAAAVYGAFLKGETDILVGTRLLARGHDFPNLSVIGVIDSDAGLSTADFRASEKVFQTLFEACSTLETAAAEPEFMVQTRQPRHYIFSVLPDMDYRKFARDELAARKDFFYPPFSELVRLGFASFDPKALADFSGEALKALDFPAAPDDPAQPQAEILGPMAVSDLKKSRLLKEYYLVKLPDEAALAYCLERLRPLKPPKSVKFKITADPYGMK